MKWFTGSIGEAVASSKAKSAVFVVFVEGPDDVSKSTAAAIESPDVVSKLESDDFVAIKLDSGSEEYKQFTEIYRIVPVPSLFFIGSDGRPIEIVAGVTDAAAVVTRVDLVLSKTVTPSTKPVAHASSSRASPATPAVLAGGQTAGDRLAGGQTAGGQTAGGQTAGDRLAGDTSTSSAGETAEERLSKAKALVEKTRQAKLAEDKAKEREMEEDRRRVGREVQELRRWQQDQEMKQMKEDREREKREDLAARERVKQQILQDKAERAKRNQTSEQQASPETGESTAPQAKTTSTSDTARLQIRLPDGSAVTTQLPSTAQLRQLRSFVSQQLNQSTDFLMSTSFPRRELLVSEDELTLADLSLIPTAVILVLPGSSGGRITSSGSAATGVIAPVTSILWTLISPVLRVLSYVRTLVFGAGGGAGASDNETAKRSRLTTQQQQQQQSDGEGKARQASPRQASTRQGGTTSVRRQGNVHRLVQPQDSSDEDNNTWNGNSTQQM